MVEIPTNTTLLREILTGFIRNEVQKTGLTRVVVGLSGGVDSALSAMLAAEALGPKNVLAVLMPYKSSHPDSRAHAEMIAQASGIESMFADITPQIDAYFERFPDADARRRGNKMARERMTILYDHSARWSGLVLGTSNKTELLLGYGTLHGDMASAINPLGDLYGAGRSARRAQGDRAQRTVGRSLDGPNRRERVGLYLPRGGPAALSDGRSALYQAGADCRRFP